MAPKPPHARHAPAEPGRASTHGATSPDDARVGVRRAWFAPAGFVATTIYERTRLPLGARIEGPAIIEQADTTTVIPPGHAALVDPSGNLRLRRAE